MKSILAYSLVSTFLIAYIQASSVTEGLTKASKALEEHRHHSAIAALKNLLSQPLAKEEKACGLWLRSNAYRQVNNYREASLDLGSLSSLHSAAIQSKSRIRR
jgi:hypothetical protein